MKVFISWSGELSRNIAFILRDWIPQVLHSVVPFVSTKDIAKGNSWFESIATELKNSEYGILCLTNDNTREPWLNFEAGALFSKFDKSRVCPFLFNIEPREIDEPLQNLQVTFITEDDVFLLISSLNRIANELDDERLNKVFKKFWPDLKESLGSIKVEKKQFEHNENTSFIQQTRSSKIKAAEIVWEEILYARELGKPLFDFFYSISEEEYNLAYNNELCRKLLNSFSDVDIISKINSTSNAKKYRPYIDDYLWELYTEYKAFIGRNAFLLEQGIKRKNIIDWRKDKFTCDTLNPLLEDDEKDFIYSVKYDAFGRVVEVLESKILSEIQKLTS